MSSLSNNQVNSRSMNGLTNVNANNGNFGAVDTDYLTVNIQGNAPTVSALDNSTKIATTQWVSSHTGVNYVDLTNTQTITGQKTFSNANTFITGNLNVPTIKTTLGTSMTISTDPVGYTDNMTISTANDLTLNAGFNAVLNCFQGAFSATNAMTFSSGSNINFNGVGSVFNGTNLSFNNTGGTTVFNYVLPSCSIAPTTGNHLCNKTYVDSVSSSPIATNNVWTGTNAFNTSLPTSTLTPTTSTQLTTKTYVDSNFCDLSNAQTILGDKTFGIVGAGPPFDYTYFETITVFNVDVQLNQVDTTTMTSTQLGYTLQNTSRSTDSTNTQVSNGTTKAILTFTPAKGVWAVNFSWKLTANTSGGSGQIDGYEICISTTSASLTEYRNFYVLRELNDALGGAGGIRDRNSLSGVINTTGSTAFYINANIRFSGLASPNTVYLAIPMLTYTRIG